MNYDFSKNVDFFGIDALRQRQQCFSFKGFSCIWIETNASHHMQWVCLQFVIVVFSDHTHLLFYAKGSLYDHLHFVHDKHCFCYQFSQEVFDKKVFHHSILILIDRLPVMSHYIR